MRVPYRSLLIIVLVMFSGVAGAAVTCGMVGSVYTCTDGNTGASSGCSMVNGVYVCSDTSSGPQGNTCITNNTTGAVSCIDMSGGGGNGGLTLGGGLGSLLNSPRPSPSSGWLSKLTWWFSYAISTFFNGLVGFLKDLVTYVLSTVLSLIASAISVIGVPSWLKNYSLGNVLGQTGAVTLFFMGQLQIPISLGLIGAGYAFRLVRKFLTVFQW